MVNFFEAFEDLNVDDRSFEYFSGVSVEKVNASKSKKLALIYCKSEQFLSYRIVKNMESRLYKQVFKKMGIFPHLILSYPFAYGEDTKKILKMAEDSFQEELRVFNKYEYVKFCRKPIQVEGNKLIISCDDDFLCHQKSEEIRDFYVSRFRQCFDRDILVEFSYQKPKERPKHEVEVYTMELVEEDPVEVASDKKPFEPKKFNKKPKVATDPSVFYGKNVEGDVIPIKEIIDEIGEVVIDGKVLSLEEREIKGDKLIVTFAITDFTDTIKCKLFIKKDLAEELSLFEMLKKGNFIRVKGFASFDTYDKEIRIGNLVGMKEIKNFKEGRKDTAPIKRVELHAHTQMSDMDAMTNCKQMVNRAHDWGHPAIAITDHGVLQSFPDANHAIEGYDDDFKVIYGCEAYLVDDLFDTVLNEHGQTLQDSFVVFDLETTGFSPSRNKIIEFGAVKVVNGEITERFSTFVDPQLPIPPRITEVTTITDDMVKGAPLIEEVLPQFLEFCKGCVLVAHNSEFDYSFIQAKGKEQGLDTEFTVLDTVGISRVLFPHLGKYTLDNVAKVLKISLLHHHRAVEDAEATAEIFEKLIVLL
nr:PHP domain-containing protein [Eubacterium sp.]